MQLMVSKSEEDVADIDIEYELFLLDLANALPNWFYTKKEVRSFVVTRCKLLKLLDLQEDYMYLNEL